MHVDVGIFDIWRRNLWVFEGYSVFEHIYINIEYIFGVEGGRVGVGAGDSYHFVGGEGFRVVFLRGF